MVRNGVPVKPAHELPASFPNSNFRRVSPDVYERLIRLLERFYDREIERLAEPLESGEKS